VDPDIAVYGAVAKDGAVAMGEPATADELPIIGKVIELRSTTESCLQSS
jgi:hypothetical protein